MRRLFLLFLLSIALLCRAQQDSMVYQEISWPTPNVAEGVVNEVKGVVLHHTATPTLLRALSTLIDQKRGVGAHCVIDTDGTRYILCAPTAVTFHAGPSVLDGRESCNYFTIGIEFQGNTVKRPLTDDQIRSAIEYLLPLIKQYHIDLRYIVTHAMVRSAYKDLHPEARVYGKVDITPAEYRRFMAALREALGLPPRDENDPISTVITTPEGEETPTAGVE